MTELSQIGRIDPATEWRDLVVLARIAETPDIVSVWLADPAGSDLPAFRAGQHLVVDLPVRGGRPLRRTYTVSSSPAERRHYRLTVKREHSPAGRPDLPDGQGSAAIHALREGDVLRCLPPRGGFVLDESQRPVVLCAGGVGITPMISMLAELADAPMPRRPVWLLHACRTAADRALGVEAAALANRHGAAQVLVFFEDGSMDGSFSGRINIDTFRAVLPFDDYSFYLCGPPGFMVTLQAGLRNLNIAADRISQESFGARSEQRESSVAASASLHISPTAQVQTPTDADTGPMLTFAASGIVGRFSNADASLLAAARRLGVDLLHSCEEGVCGTCRCRLVSGDVDYVSDPIAWLEPGEVLTCISRPRGDVVLDV